MNRSIDNEQVSARTQSRHIVPRIVTGIAGAALVYYGWRRKKGMVGGIASSLGFSLIVKSVDNPALIESVRTRTGIFNRARVA